MMFEHIGIVYEDILMMQTAFNVTNACLSFSLSLVSMGLVFHSQQMNALQVRAKQKQLSLSWDVAQDVPVHLVGDAGRLQQCILNLGMMFLRVSFHASFERC